MLIKPQPILMVVIALIFMAARPPISGPALAETPPDRSPENHCPPLPIPAGAVQHVSSESTLRDLAYNAAPGTTLLLAPGVYQMQGFLHVNVPGLSIRGVNGQRQEVILDFGGMQSGYFGILVEADDVTLADLTIRNAHDHGVAIQGVDRPVLYNLHIMDTRDQLVKVNPEGDGSEDGLLACSRLEYTTSAPDDYTNGISAHQASRWVVRDNEWLRIRGINDVTGPTILFWSGSTDTIVERNRLLDCYRGIAFGNPSHSGVDHRGGVVRNNMLAFTQPHDVAIEMVHAAEWVVAHNTALLLNPAQGLTWGMEARFTDSSGEFAYNLTNLAIWGDRDGASATLTGNLTTAQQDWFYHPGNGDLHLQPGVLAVIDQAAPHPQVWDDFDGQSRPAGSAADLGADEVWSNTLEAQIYLPLARR